MSAPIDNAPSHGPLTSGDGPITGGCTLATVAPRFDLPLQTGHLQRVTDDLRPAELAGSWYPATEEECDQFLEQVPKVECAELIAALVPHAGWVYSGAVAYGALEAVAKSRPKAKLVIVFGGHLSPRDRPRIFIEGGWQTPYGPMMIDKALAEDLSMAMESELETPEEYYDDNAVEVIIPMAKKLWPKAQLLTVGVPPTADATKLAAELMYLTETRGYQPDSMVLIGSTDLTHYGPNYNFQPHGRGHPGHRWVTEKNDPEIIEKMLELNASRIVWTAQRSRNACSPGAVAATIAAAQKLGAKNAKLTEYTTSWDVRPTEGEPMSFVGYAGIVIGA